MARESRYPSIFGKNDPGLPTRPNSPKRTTAAWPTEFSFGVTPRSFTSDLNSKGRLRKLCPIALRAPRRGNGSPSRIELSGRSTLPWAFVKIRQLIYKIKIKGEIRKKSDVLADRAAASACLKAAARCFGRIIRWHVIAASIAATRRQNGENGRPGTSIGKPIMGNKSAVLKAADIECGRRNGRNKRPTP